jgi:hypothetical protein
MTRNVIATLEEGLPECPECLFWESIRDGLGIPRFMCDACWLHMWKSCRALAKATELEPNLVADWNLAMKSLKGGAHDAYDSDTASGKPRDDVHSMLRLLRG